MCGICNVVNCIRRNLFCCGRNHGNSDCGCSEYRESRYCEPRTNVVCANNRESCFTPCCDDESTRCNHHHHSHGCNCGCND